MRHRSGRRDAWAAARCIGVASLLAGCQGQIVTAPGGGWTPPAGDSPSDVAGQDDSTRDRASRDDGEPVEEGASSALPSCFEDDFASEEASGSGGDVAAPCEVTAGCREPLLCVEGACRAPGEDGRWCDGIDIACPNDGTSCVGGLCVFLGNNCARNVDCPAGYICASSACRAENGDCVVDSDCGEGAICDFGFCVDVDSCAVDSDLSGEFAVASLLHLGQASTGVVGAVLEASEWVRDLLEGRGGIPGVGFLVDDIVRDFIVQNLYDYQIDAIIALGDVSDLLDDVRIEHTMGLDASCREIYRGTLSFDEVEVDYRGETISDRPEDIPAVGQIPDAEFGATLRCQTLAIDEFRVDHLVGGLVRWVVDGVVQQASEGAYFTVEEALADVVDCRAIGNAVEDAAGLVTATAAEAACDEAIDDAIDGVTGALDGTAFEMGLMRLEGQVYVQDDDTLEDGHWSGSLLTGDFEGEWSAVRR